MQWGFFQPCPHGIQAWWKPSYDWLQVLLAYRYWMPRKHFTTIHQHVILVSLCRCWSREIEIHVYPLSQGNSPCSDYGKYSTSSQVHLLHHRMVKCDKLLIIAGYHSCCALSSRIRSLPSTLQPRFTMRVQSIRHTKICAHRSYPLSIILVIEGGNRTRRLPSVSITISFQFLRSDQAG